MKMMLAAGLTALVSTTVLAQEINVEGCVTVGASCQYDARSGGSIFGQGSWKVEVWWNTTCAAKSGDPDWMVASAGGSATEPGDGNNVGGVAGTWEGAISDEHTVSCARATALTGTSSVAIGNFPPLPEE